MKAIFTLSAVFLLAALSTVTSIPLDRSNINPELTKALDSMSLQSLANAAKEYPYLQQLILEDYIVGKFHLDESLIVMDLTRREPNMLLDVNYLADGLDATLSVLELFGPVFTRLNIEIDLPGCKENVVHQIAAVVTKYCSNASQKIHLSIRYAYYNIQFQFPHATEVEFLYDYADFDSPEIDDPIELNQVFPRMQKLRALTVRDAPLNQHFPYLTHFELVAQHNDNDNDNLRIFFRENPQLRSIKAPMLCKFPYLVEVNELLPELESLSINYDQKFYAPLTGGVHFKNVKEFSLNLERFDGDIPQDLIDSLSSLEFGELKTLNLASSVKSPESNEFLLGLITQHQQLAKLTFQLFDLSNAELVKLLKQLPHLKTLQISCVEPAVFDEIHQFLLEDNNLTALVISDRTHSYRKFKAMIDSVDNWQLLGQEVGDSGTLLELGKIQLSL